MPPASSAPSDAPPPAVPRRIVLVEDDTLLRDLLTRSLREKLVGAEVVAFGTGRPAIDYCLAAPPDLLVTDLRLPDIDGREIVRRVAARSRTTRHLVLTSNVTPALPAELLAIGVTGFVDKASSFDQVEAAVRRVLGGGMHFSAEVTPTPALTAAAVGRGVENEPGVEVLSDREREIARHVAAGLVSKEVADRLGLSLRTVEKGRARILAKLNVRDAAGLVRWCVRHGLA